MDGTFLLHKPDAMRLYWPVAECSISGASNTDGNAGFLPAGVILKLLSYGSVLGKITRLCHQQRYRLYNTPRTQPPKAFHIQGFVLD